MIDNDMSMFVIAMVFQIPALYSKLMCAKKKKTDLNLPPCCSVDFHWLLFLDCRPIIKDIKSCGEDSCFEELLLNVHAILHLTDCISLTFNPWNKLDWMNQSLTSLQVRPQPFSISTQAECFQLLWKAFLVVNNSIKLELHTNDVAIHTKY